VQVQAILDACAWWDTAAGAWRGSLRNRLLFALLAETGMRLGEALCLFHDDFVAGRGDTPYVLVTPREHPHQQRVKGWRSRRIYVSDRLEALHGDYLWEVCDRGGAEAVDNLGQWWLFVNVDREPLFAAMRPETVYDTVRRIKHRLGNRVPAGFTPHWLRHTHATALLMSGAPLPLVQQRMGHADVQTTINTYGWVTEDAAGAGRVAVVHRRLGPCVGRAVSGTVLPLHPAVATLPPVCDLPGPLPRSPGGWRTR
jgi:site-specific recombinase XerD